MSDVDGQTTEYAVLDSRLNEEFRVEAKRRLLTIEKNVPPIDHHCSAWSDLRTGQELFFDVFVTNNSLHSQLDAVKKISGDSALGSFHYEPILFDRKAHINKRDKLSLAYRAFVLGKGQNRMPDCGTIVFGSKFTQSRIRLEPYLKDISLLIDSLLNQVIGENTPSLCLNRHCHICQFKNSCKEEAQARDHLSLLCGISEKEIARNNRKGIFTVTQLSYTFRSRRRPKRAKPATPPHSYPLQALALRENQVYIHGSPVMPSASSHLYFDIEGLPEKGFDYLIGLIVDANGAQRHHYFWAENEGQQQEIYAQFVQTLEHYNDYLLFHFGSYEKTALKRMQFRLPEKYKKALDSIQERTVNLLSIVHSHIYFPTWSNSLKEIAAFLGFEWSDGEVSGLQSIVWRENWDRTREFELKERLIRYNRDDCLALKRVADFITSTLSRAEATPQCIEDAETTFVHTREMQSSTYGRDKFGKPEFVVPEFNFINNCAYFDYQRERVFIRTKKEFKQINRRIKVHQTHRIRPNKVLEIYSQVCPLCRSRKIRPKYEIRLIRDMNDDLLENPFERELKDLTQRFANLLRDIVETIDKYGLKQWHLKKHKRSVTEFIQYVVTTNFSSDISKQYQKRIEKYSDRLFTFLDYDGVPWNNNNAEHAIKSFARYRRFSDGRCTEKSISDYLMMLSVFQTCEYRNIDILEFLLSKANDFI